MSGRVFDMPFFCGGLAGEGEVGKEEGGGRHIAYQMRMFVGNMK